MAQEETTLKTYGRQTEQLRQALSYRWKQLGKIAKKNEDEGVTSDAREKMVIIEEIMRALEPQVDLVDEIQRMPEAFND